MPSPTASPRLPCSPPGKRPVPAPHPLARRIHDRVLQLLGTALLKTEMCEQLGRLGREGEIVETLVELRRATGVLDVAREFKP